VTDVDKHWVEALIACQSEEEQSQLLETLTAMPERADVEALAKEILRQYRIDLLQSERLTKAVCWLANRFNDSYCQGICLKFQGNLSMLRNSYQESLDYHERAAVLFRREGAEHELAVTMSNSLHSMVMLGRYEQAFATVEVAHEIFERFDNQLWLTNLTCISGFIYNRLDQFETALRLFERSLRSYRELGCGAQEIVPCLSNLAVCLIAINEFSRALEAYQELSEYCDQHGLTLLAAQADYNIAYLYQLRGEYSQALELYSLTRKRCQDVGDQYHRALCDLDSSEIYLELNLSEEGFRLAQCALCVFEELDLGYESAKAVVFTAVARLQQGRPDAALSQFEEGRKRFEREGNQVWMVMIDLYQGMVLFEEGRFQEAAAIALRAVSFFVQSRHAAKTILAELLLARIELRMNQADSALGRCQDAQSRLTALDLPALRYQTYFVLGEVEEARGNREAALSAYQKAREELERLCNLLRGEELKISFIKDKLEVYESLVTLTMAGEPSATDVCQAFMYLEEAKSRRLAELIAFRAQELPVDDPENADLVALIRQLRERISSYYRRVDDLELGKEPASQELIEEAYSQCREHEDRLLRARRELQRHSSDLASLQYGVGESLETIQAAVPEDAFLIEYYQARETTFVCIVGPDLLQVMPLIATRQADEAQRLLRLQLGKNRLGSEYVKTFTAQLERATKSHLLELYRLMVAPIRHYLDCKRLIFVPHGALHQLPFHALFDGERYLLEEYSVSYAPSAGVYAMCRNRRVEPRQRSLVLGVVGEEIPAVRDEVEAVADTLGDVDLLLNLEATAARLRELGPKSRFLHIATHGRFRRDNPMFSAIELGDSRLTLFDLYQLRLGCELVTLSGCGTGLGTIESGDELIGLTRGLLHAGAHSALVTLWDVHDRSTAELMIRFYEQLLANISPADALRLAMLELLDQYPHPYYWAPFILVGRS
jgi:CHAT domain-containing protein/predicted negative regulator of RcsB-dependent stress response